MKALKGIAWGAGIIAGIIIILAVIALIIKTSFFGFVHIVNYFHTANTFLLIAICCTLYANSLCKEEQKK